MKEFIDVIKNILVVCCLLATLCSTCRQEQANDKLTAEINALQTVSSDLQECAFQTQIEGENQ